MYWFLYALIPPALWAAVNHIDKYLLTRYFKTGGPGALLIFSALIGAFLLPVIAVIEPAVIHSFGTSSLLIALSGILFVLANLPYFYALQTDEVTIAVSLFQLIPLFSYVLGLLFLGESLTVPQCAGGVMILTGALVMTMHRGDMKRIMLRKSLLALMSLSSFLYALNFILFKYFTFEASFWVVSFWEYAGFTVFAIVLLVFVRRYRDEFFLVLRINGRQALALNSLNEGINIAAKISFNVASLLAPVTLTWLVNGLQPFFVFVYGILLTFFFPAISREDLSRRVVFQKLFAMCIMLSGTLLLGG